MNLNCPSCNTENDVTGLNPGQIIECGRCETLLTLTTGKPGVDTASQTHAEDRELAGAGAAT